MSPLPPAPRHRGPPLVLIHGIGSQWQMWEPVLDALGREREVIALDLPGFGDSRALPTHAPTRRRRWRARSREFLDELGLERPHVAGNSLGGAVALELARAGAARSACALSPAGFVNGREGRYAKLVLRRRAGRRAARSRRCAELLARGPRAPHADLAPARRAPVAGPADEAAGAMRNLGRSPGFEATLRGVEDWSEPDAGPPTVPGHGRLGREGPAPALLAPERRARGGAARRPPRHAHRLRARPDLGRPGAGRAGPARRVGLGVRVGGRRADRRRRDEGGHDDEDERERLDGDAERVRATSTSACASTR